MQERSDLFGLYPTNNKKKTLVYPDWVDYSGVWVGRGGGRVQVGFLGWSVILYVAVS